MILAKASQIDYMKSPKAWDVTVSLISLDSGSGVVVGRAQSSRDANIFYDIYFLTKQGAVSCTCPGFEHTATPCKHIAAFGLVINPLFHGIRPNQIQR